MKDCQQAISHHKRKPYQFVVRRRQNWGNNQLRDHNTGNLHNTPFQHSYKKTFKKTDSGFEPAIDAYNTKP
jgi:hypothetical protein